MKAEGRMTNGEWPKVALDEIAEFNPRLPETLTADDNVSFVPMSVVSAETAGITHEETRTYAEVSKGYTPFVSGDVLVAKITPCFENGKIAQARLTQRAGFGSTEFHVVRARPTKLESLTGTTGKDDYANVIQLDNTFSRYFVNQRVALIEPKPNVLDRHYLLHVFRNPKVKARLTSKSRGIRQANISNGERVKLSFAMHAALL